MSLSPSPFPESNIQTMSLFQDLFSSSSSPKQLHKKNPFLRAPLAEKNINSTPRTHKPPVKQLQKSQDSPCIFSSNAATKRTRSTSLFPPPSLMSPTTSLAADMSQNFHIDRTPALPTPRRTLFPSTINEHMASPELPRKISSCSSISGSSSCSSIQSVCSTESATSTDSVNSKAAASSIGPRRRDRIKSLSNASFLMQNRPSLSWGLSGDADFSNSSPQTSSLSLASTSSQFSDSLKSKPTPTANTPSSEYDEMEIDSFFEPSPMTARVASGAGLPTRDSFDSPITNRPNYPCKIRRIHSMFEKAQDVVTEELKETQEAVAYSTNSDLAPSSCESLLDHPDCEMATFTVQEDPFHRIEPQTLCEILDGKYKHVYDKFKIIDCRFEYEYRGGHIDGAVNINTKHDLESQLLSNPNNEKQLLVFHCEYSAHRGPRMAMHLRNCDRHINMANYPNLHYPDIVVLHGGYSNFFERYYGRCFPQRYVEMNDSSHRQTCEREMDRFRKNMKFSRTQSYTFGSLVNNNVNSDRTTPCGSSFRFPPSEHNTTPTAPSNRNRLIRIHSEKLFA